MSQLVIGGVEYVAKKLVDAGRGCGKAMLDEANNFLTSDLIHLKRMVVFSDTFIMCAIRVGAEVTGNSVMF